MEPRVGTRGHHAYLMVPAIVKIGRYIAIIM
jgi:hypothetical protein